MASESLTVGQFLCEYLESKGVKHIFGIPGDFATHSSRLLLALILLSISSLTACHKSSSGGGGAPSTDGRT